MQNLVKDFNNQKNCHREPMPVYARLMDIESEVGELEKEYLKSSNYGTKDFEVTDDFKEEFGDVVYAILSLSNTTCMVLKQLPSYKSIKPNALLSRMLLAQPPTVISFPPNASLSA